MPPNVRRDRKARRLARKTLTGTVRTTSVTNYLRTVNAAGKKLQHAAETREGNKQMRLNKHERILILTIRHLTSTGMLHTAATETLIHNLRSNHTPAHSQWLKNGKLAPLP